MESVEARENYTWRLIPIIWFTSLTVVGLLGFVYMGLRLSHGIMMPFDFYTQTTFSSFVSYISVFETPWYMVLIQTILTGLFGWFFFRYRLYAITCMHRAYVHRSLDIVKKRVHVFITLGFYGAIQSLLRVWVGWHNQHHHMADTKDDRHSPVVYGFWHSHMLWTFKKEFIGPAPRKYFVHLYRDEFKFPMSFEKYYGYIAFGMAFVLPTLVCTVWLDPVGGFLFASVTGLLVLYHTTWSINSVMHTFGEQIAGSKSARNSLYVSFIKWVVGEPNHAHHHKWPWSYRFGKIDPGADKIEWMERKGWVTNLKVPDELKT